MDDEKEKITEKRPIKFRLARVLGLSDATLIGVGALLGGGIFTLTGLALSFAGPSLILVVGLNGVIALMTTRKDLSNIPPRRFAARRPN